MGIPFKGYYDPIECSLEEGRKDGVERTRSVQRLYGVEDTGTARHGRQFELERAASQWERDGGEQYDLLLEVHRSLLEADNGPRARAAERREESLTRRRTIARIMEEHERRFQRPAQQDEDAEEEHIDVGMPEETELELCQGMADRIYSYLRNVGRRVRSLSPGDRNYHFAWAFQAIQIILGYRNEFDTSRYMNHAQYSRQVNYSRENMVRRLMRLSRSHRTPEQSLQAFHEAIEEGNLAAVFQSLGVIRCSMALVGPSGDTALHLACLHGHHEIAQFLLDMGHSPDPVDADGASPLHDAAAGGFESILKLLIQAAPHCLNTADNDLDTPLHNAARGDHCACVSVLLEAGADAESRNSMSLRPIDLTTRGGPTYIRLLQQSM